MAKELIVKAWDDRHLRNGVKVEADQAVIFSVRYLNGDGKFGPAEEVELDLTSENLSEFMDTVAQWLEIGSRSTAQSAGPRLKTKDGKSRLPRGARPAPAGGRTSALSPAEQRTQGMDRRETSQFLRGLRQWAKSAGREEEYLPLPGRPDFRYSRDLIDSYDAWLESQVRAG